VLFQDFYITYSLKLFLKGHVLNLENVNFLDETNLHTLNNRIFVKKSFEKLCCTNLLILMLKSIKNNWWMKTISPSIHHTCLNSLIIQNMDATTIKGLKITSYRSIRNFFIKQKIKNPNFIYLFIFLQQTALYSIENNEPKNTLQPNQTSRPSRRRETKGEPPGPSAPREDKLIEGAHTRARVRLVNFHTIIGTEDLVPIANEHGLKPRGGLRVSMRELNPELKNPLPCHSRVIQDAVPKHALDLFLVPSILVEDDGVATKP
jgi:hypothetical protein